MVHPERSERSVPSRREFVALGIGAFVVATMPAAFRRRRALVRRTVPVMGTIADIAVVHQLPRYAESAIDAAIAELRFVDRTMTRFDSASDVGRANHAAAGHPVAVSDPTALVLGAALEWAEASGGAFDPCLGRALALWDVGHRQTPPPEAEVRRFAGRELFRALEIGRDTKSHAVRFHDPDVAIDLGGIAKGYAVDRAVAALRSYGIYNAIVNAGGDLYALGVSEDGDPWKIGIRDPRHPDRIIHTIEASDRAIATSGDYIQYFQYRGRRYHHMLDPRTDEPVRAPVHSVTVVADNCLAADAAGTAVFGMTEPEAERLLRARAPGARVAYRC